MQGITATINPIASSESCVLLELHERIAIPGLLNNSQSWVLNRTDTMELERTEIQALKSLFHLPMRTPNTAIVYTFGTLYKFCSTSARQIVRSQDLETSIKPNTVAISR